MSSENDPFGKKPERSPSDRLRAAKSRLGRLTVPKVVALGILVSGGGYIASKEVKKGDSKTPVELVKKLEISTLEPKDPSEDINVRPGLPKEAQMGDQTIPSVTPQASEEVVTAQISLSKLLNKMDSSKLPNNLETGEGVIAEREAQEDFEKMETPPPPQPSAEELKKLQSQSRYPQDYYPTDRFGLGESAQHYNYPKK